jgi:hypothetical protein
MHNEFTAIIEQDEDWLEAEEFPRLLIMRKPVWPV